jgi:hypothetical protein
MTNYLLIEKKLSLLDAENSGKLFRLTRHPSFRHRLKKGIINIFQRKSLNVKRRFEPRRPQRKNRSAHLAALQLDKVIAAKGNFPNRHLNNCNLFRNV